MFQRLITGWILSFVLKQIEKAEGKIDWTALRVSIDDGVRKLLPGTWFDDEGVALANKVVSALETILENNENEAKLLKLIAGKDFLGAAALLKDMLLGAFAHASDASAYETISSLQVV
jgi:hypothetical protein